MTVRYHPAMLRLIRRLILNLFFGPSTSTRPPPLNDDQNFQLQQYRMGLMTDGEWRDLLDHDAVLSQHYRFHHPDVPAKS